MDNAPRLIDFAAVSAASTLKKTALYEEINAGRLRPVKLGRKTVFVESEVDDWIRERIAASRCPSAIAEAPVASKKRLARENISKPRQTLAKGGL